MASWAENIKPHNVVDLSDEGIANLVNKIKKSKSSKTILAYACAYEVICKYFEKTNTNLRNNNIKSLISIVEGLSQYTIDTVEKYFGLSIISRYSNNGNGIIAQQDYGSSYYGINWASYMVELFNLENDNPANYGDQGRIVLTDLYNYAVPMIRYDTGDIGIMNVLENEPFPVLMKFEGRKMEMLYNTKGELITSHIVNIVAIFEGVKQYQLIQLGKKSIYLKLIKPQNLIVKKK